MEEQPAAWLDLAAGLAATALVALLLVTWRIHRRQRIWRRLAARFGGRFRRGAIFGRRGPSVRWDENGMPIVAQLWRAGRLRGHRFIQLETRWPNPRLRWEIYPHSLFTRLRKLLGMPCVPSGSTEFDRRFVVRGNAESQIRSLLAGALPAAIERLHELADAGDVFVGCHSGKLLIKVRTRAASYQQLERVVSAALEVVNDAWARRDEGIDFISEPLGADHAGPSCLVCGQPILARAVFCRSCSAPHHRECWRYFGKCATYGCGQRRYRRHGAQSTRAT